MNVLKHIELKPKEEVIEIIHESILPRVWVFALLVAWFTLPFFFLFALFRVGAWGVAVFFILVVSAFIFLLRYFLQWAKTVLVITDKRVIDFEQRGFFDREVTEAPYSRIDETTYRVKGFFPTIFRYGKIRLHLRGSSADIEFYRVTKPSRVHDLINDLRAEYDAEK